MYGVGTVTVHFKQIINKAGIISCSCAWMGRLYYRILLPLLRTVRVPVTVIVWLMMPCWLHWPDHDLGLLIGVASLMPYACQPAETVNCCLPWASDSVWSCMRHACNGLPGHHVIYTFTAVGL